MPYPCDFTESKYSNMIKSLTIYKSRHLRAPSPGEELDVCSGVFSTVAAILFHLIFFSLDTYFRLRLITATYSTVSDAIDTVFLQHVDCCKL
jgi:hypothetical protein